MKTFRFFYVLAFIMLFSSCGQIISTIYGIHKPRIESQENLIKYLKKKGLNQDNIYFLKDTAAFYDHHRAHRGVPKVYVYNRDYLQIDIIKKDTCSKQSYDFIDSLSTAIIYPVDSNKTLKQVLENFVTPEGQVTTIGMLQKSDFYAVIYWAKYAGRFNKRDMDYWDETLLAKRDSMKIEILKVNCDPLESWVSEK